MNESIDSSINNGTGARNFKGEAFTVNSFRNLLQNKRYTGHYIYGDIDIPNGIPRIIDDELFDRVQQKIRRNKIAPSSNLRYLLTSKVFCGECGSIMIGVSGTSHTGKQYSYYSCNNYRAKKCDLRNIPKEKLEDIVVDECRKRLTDDAIKVISVEVSRLSAEEYNSPIVQGIKKEISSCDKAIDNLLSLLEKGQEADLLLARVTSKRQEKTELERRLAEETLGKVILSEEEIAFFLHSIRNGNINSFKYRQGLINTLVNKVVVYHDRILIFFNSSSDPIKIDQELIDKVKEASSIESASGSCTKASGVPSTDPRE